MAIIYKVTLRVPEKKKKTWVFVCKEKACTFAAKKAEELGLEALRSPEKPSRRRTLLERFGVPTNIRPGALVTVDFQETADDTNRNQHVWRIRITRARHRDKDFFLRHKAKAISLGAKFAEKYSATAEKRNETNAAQWRTPQGDYISVKKVDQNIQALRFLENG